MNGIAHDSDGGNPPRLYAEFAPWWPLMSAPEDYAEDADIYAGLLDEACDGSIKTLLELGSGGGNNAVHMKERFGELVLTDISPGMIEVSRNLNPECDHRVGDMRTVRLDRTFDAVFVHDAICYMTTERELLQVIETAWAHCRRGGAVLLAPDYVRENFRPATDEGGHDESLAPEGEDCPRGLRFLEWVWDLDPNDTQYVVDYAYLLRDRYRSVRVAHDRHVEGLFARERWQALLQEVGFTARAVPLDHSEVEPGRHEMFVGKRPA